MWAVFAFGSAVFAALTSVLAKIGINGVQSNLATAVRTVVVLVMAWGMVFLTDGQGGIASVSRKSWLFYFACFLVFAYIIVYNASRTAFILLVLSLLYYV